MSSLFCLLLHVYFCLFLFILLKNTLGGINIMNKSFKIILSTIIILCISTLTVIGIQNHEKIEVFYRDIKVYIDGKEVNPQEKPFIYNDRMYVPIRFFSESLNALVSWDDKNNSLSISSYEDYDEAKPLDGERFVYCEILSIDREKRTLHIYQHIDDNSVYEKTDLRVSKDAIIVLQRNTRKMNLNFEDLKIGDVVGMVVNKENEVRGITVDS